MLTNWSGETQGVFVCALKVLDIPTVLRSLPLFVTRHSSVTSPELREKIWRLYELAYRRTAEDAASRETLYRHEFDEVLSDPANRLWVLWSDQDPVAATLIGTDVSATRYLSQAFFEKHYPDHTLRNAIHCILWVVVHPSHVAKGALVRLAKDTFAIEADEGALLVFDTPRVNQPEETGGLAEMMSRLASMVSLGTTVEQIEIQRYYAVDFAHGRRHQALLVDDMLTPSFT
jgi:hypothetical protein